MDFFFGDTPSSVFTAAAIFGTVFFLIRLALMFMGVGDTDFDGGGGGGGGGGDFGGGHDAGFDMGHLDVDPTIDAHHPDSSHAFKMLSIQSIATFIMGFGWGAIGAYRGSDMGVGASLAIGAIIGVAMVWLLGWLLKGVYDLQSSGNFPIRALVGRPGEVYLTVPAARGPKPGVGKVRVTFDSRRRIFNALSEGDAIPTGSRVRVVRVHDDLTLTVAPDATS